MNEIVEKIHFFYLTKIIFDKQEYLIVSYKFLSWKHIMNICVSTTQF
jgi:hypothetical protein